MPSLDRMQVARRPRCDNAPFRINVHHVEEVRAGIMPSRRHAELPIWQPTAGEGGDSTPTIAVKPQRCPRAWGRLFAPKTWRRNARADRVIAAVAKLSGNVAWPAGSSLGVGAFTIGTAAQTAEACAAVVD
jgi:hypothetical protein